MYLRRRVFSVAEDIPVSEVEPWRSKIARYEYDKEMDARKKRRRGGHVMGAFGTAGLLFEGTGAVLNHRAGNSLVRNGIMGLGAAALTAGGLYRINKEKNKHLSFDEYMMNRKKKKED